MELHRGHGGAGHRYVAPGCFVQCAIPTPHIVLRQSNVPRDSVLVAEWLWPYTDGEIALIGVKSVRVVHAHTMVPEVFRRHIGVIPRTYQSQFRTTRT